MNDEKKWPPPTLAEWMEKVRQEQAAFRKEMKRGFTRGDWTYDPKRLVLIHGPSEYEIDLETMTTSAEVLDWLAQVRGKPEMSNESLGTLVVLLDDMLGLQIHYCGEGTDHGPVDVKTLLKNI